MPFGENVKAFFKGKPRQTRWQLADAVAMNTRYPEDFWIPSTSQILFLRPTDIVKLIFEPRKADDELVGERMWVTITEVKEDGFIGTLNNDPIVWHEYLSNGETIYFSAENIIDIYELNHVLSYGILNAAVISLPKEPVKMDTIKTNHMRNWATDLKIQSDFHASGEQHNFLDWIDINDLESGLNELSEYKRAVLPEGMLHLDVGLDSTTTFVDGLIDGEVEKLHSDSAQQKVYLSHGQMFGNPAYYKESSAVYRNVVYPNLIFLYMSATTVHKNDPDYYRYLIIIHKDDRTKVPFLQGDEESSISISTLDNWFQRPVSQKYMSLRKYDRAEFEWLRFFSFEKALKAYALSLERNQPKNYSVIFVLQLKPTSSIEEWFTEEELDTPPWKWESVIYAYEEGQITFDGENESVSVAEFGGIQYPKVEFVYIAQSTPNESQKYERQLVVRAKTR